MFSAPVFDRPLLDPRSPVKVASIEHARALLSELTADDLLQGRVVVSRRSMPRLDSLSRVSAPMLRDLVGAPEGCSI